MYEVENQTFHPRSISNYPGVSYSYTVRKDVSVRVI